MADLPEIEAEAVSSPVDLTRSAGMAGRATADAFEQASRVLGGVTNTLGQIMRTNDQAAIAEHKSGVDADIDDLVVQFKGDPNGFRAALSAARTATVERTPGRYARAVGAYFDQVGTRATTAIARERANMDIVSSKSALEQRKSVLEGKLEAWRSQGPAIQGDPDYMADLSEYAGVVQQLGNPLYGSSPEEAQARLDGAMARQRVGSALSEARNIYSSHGLAAAKTFIESTVNDPDIPLSTYDRQQLANGAREDINLLHQADVEQERATREAERDKKAAQRDRTDDLTLDAFTGSLSPAQITSEIQSGTITEAQGVRLLRMRKAAMRSSGGGRQKSESTLAREALIQAAGGDKDAAKQAAKLAERGVIDPSDAGEVAAAFKTAKGNPRVAAGVDHISTSLAERGDDRKGAIAHYMKQAALGLIPEGREMQAAQDVEKKYRGRAYSTLPAPMFGAGVPRNADDVARVASTTKRAFQNGRISQATYLSEMKNLSAWRDRSAAQRGGR